MWCTHAVKGSGIKIVSAVPLPHNTFWFRVRTEDVAGETSDPAVIRSIAVSVGDLVTALETNQTSAKEAVLRVTPPFSGRMRARLHIEQETSYSQQPEPLHIAPQSLVDDTLPAYPNPAQTEDELRTDESVEYSVERHHARHKEAVEQWRAEVPDAVKECTIIETSEGEQEVSISLLGSHGD